MTRLTLICAVGLALGVAIGCAGKGKGTKNPNDCMRECDQENCAFVAQSVGDNAEYLECLEGCQEKCNAGG